MPLKAKASLAAYCGHLQTLLAASGCWEDYLWSYLKVVIDTKVEKEIRETSLKTYIDMPQVYWNNMLVNILFCLFEILCIATEKTVNILLS